MGGKNVPMAKLFEGPKPKTLRLDSGSFKWSPDWEIYDELEAAKRRSNNGERGERENEAESGGGTTDIEMDGETSSSHVYSPPSTGLQNLRLAEQDKQ